MLKPIFMCQSALAAVRSSILLHHSAMTNTCYQLRLMHTPTWFASIGRSGWGTVFLSRTPARCRPGSSSSPFWPGLPDRPCAGRRDARRLLALPRWPASSAHDMIGFVLRKMAASVGRSAAIEREREGERESRGWVGELGRRKGRQCSDLSTSLTGQRQLISVQAAELKDAVCIWARCFPCPTLCVVCVLFRKRHTNVASDYNTNCRKDAFNCVRMVHTHEG